MQTRVIFVYLFAIFCHRFLAFCATHSDLFSDKEAIDYVREKAAEGNIAKKGMLVINLALSPFSSASFPSLQAMEKSAAVVADSLGITKGIDLMKDAGKATGGMMKVLACICFWHRLLFDVV